MPQYHPVTYILTGSGPLGTSFRLLDPLGERMAVHFGDEITEIVLWVDGRKYTLPRRECGPIDCDRGIPSIPDVTQSAAKGLPPPADPTQEPDDAAD